MSHTMLGLTGNLPKYTVIREVGQDILQLYSVRECVRESTAQRVYLPHMNWVYAKSSIWYCIHLLYFNIPFHC